MESVNFCYFLQGLFELSEEDLTEKGLSPKQTDLIKRHLQMVFEHEIDPSYGDEKHQQQLSAIHNGEGDISSVVRPPVFPNKPGVRC